MRARAALVALAIGAQAMAVVAPAAAAPRRILVLPVEGTAAEATRARLTARILRLARALEGQVSVAEATFSDTALAIGCRPQAPGCTDEVIATLGVDELIWGTATGDGAQTRLVVRHAAKGAASREAWATIAADDPADKIDPSISPLLLARRGRAEPAPTSTAGPERAAEPTAAEPTRASEPRAGITEPEREPAPGPAGPSDRRDRNLGIAFAAGGGVSLGLGIALWASYASMQRTIDGHPTRTVADFEALRALEDRAATRAIAGDLMVALGLAAGGLGAYYLYRSHRPHRVAVSPAPIGNGGGLAVTWIGGL